MNDFDDFGGSLANYDFQKETDYYDKQINAQRAASTHSTKKIGGAKAVTIFKNISDDSFSSEEKLASIRYVLSMPTYNSIYKDDFRNAVEWLYHRLVEIPNK